MGREACDVEKSRCQITQAINQNRWSYTKLPAKDCLCVYYLNNIGLCGSVEDNNMYITLHVAVQTLRTA